MIAAIDLGSNSFRLFVGRRVGEGIDMVRAAREPTRMGSGLDANGMLSELSMQRGIDGLHRLGDILQAYPLDGVRAVATHTLRVAKNAQAFLSVAERALGHPIEIISGVEEARLIYLGIAHQIAASEEHRLVIDIGGGSTEMIVGKGKDIEHAESIDIGTVWQSRQFFSGGRLDEAAFEAAIRQARLRFETALADPFRHKWANVYGSSGTLRAIGEIIARNNLGDEGVTTQSLNALKQRLISFGYIGRVNMEKVRPERTASIVSGLAILIALMEEMQIEKIRPVEGGLRLGVMWDLLLRTKA